MNSHSIMRFGGYAAIASALLYLASIVLWMGSGDAGTPPPAATALYNGSSILFLVTLFALYRLHGPEAPALSLVAALLLAISMVASLFIDPTALDDPRVLLLTACYGAGALLLGWLAWRSPRLPRGVAILAVLMGVLTLLMLPMMLAGAADITGIANLVVGLLYVAWLLWLSWIFLKGNTATAQAA